MLLPLGQVCAVGINNKIVPMEHALESWVREVSEPEREGTLIGSHSLAWGRLELPSCSKGAFISINTGSLC